MMFEYAILSYKINKSFVKNESVPTTSLVEGDLLLTSSFFFIFIFVAWGFRTGEGLV